VRATGLARIEIVTTGNARAVAPGVLIEPVNDALLPRTWWDRRYTAIREDIPDAFARHRLRAWRSNHQIGGLVAWIDYGESGAELCAVVMGNEATIVDIAGRRRLSRLSGAAKPIGLAAPSPTPYPTKPRGRMPNFFPCRLAFARNPFTTT
jgi:hypothetical protein